jgi:alpha-galactosidase
LPSGINRLIGFPLRRRFRHERRKSFLALNKRLFDKARPKMKHYGNHHAVCLLRAAASVIALYAGILWPGSSNAQEIRTPAALPIPQVNGPSIFGVRPGSPFLYKIPATGDGTLQYSVDNLPAGLSVNSATGMITGTLTTIGEYVVKLHATNTLGADAKDFRIEVGDTIGLTPAMGWNSWNCWGSSVTQDRVQAAADAMASSGLINYGWSYINIDDGWQEYRGGPYNALQGHYNFPDMQGLVNNIHGLGLKAGIYSTPWALSYSRHPGTGTYVTNDAQQWAAWGIDYLKYDWNPITLSETTPMEQALRNSGRDIIYSLSNNLSISSAAQITPHANSWRITGDMSDHWSSMSDKGFNKDSWAPYSSPGHFNDPDMLVVGNVGWGSTQYPTHLTPDEQYTHITLWSMLSAPLLLGCDLTRLDNFTLNLLTNNEVLAVDQDPLGQMATCKAGSGTNLRVYVKDMEDGSKAVGLFNLGTSAATITANWSVLGLNESQNIRDLWRQMDLGAFDSQFSMTVASHGAELLRLSPTDKGLKWTAGENTNSTDWGAAANWNSGVVPDGPGTKVRFGDQNNTNSNIIDLISAGRTVGSINYYFGNNTTIQTSGGYSLTLDNNTRPVGVNVSGYHTISAPVVLKNTLNITGTGTLRISGVITGTGSLNITSGNLILSGAKDYNGNIITGSMGKLIFDFPDDRIVNNNISGSGSLEKRNTSISPSTLTLSGNCNYTGITIVSGGILKMGKNFALGSTAVGTIIGNGATLDINGFSVGTEAITVQGSGIGGLGAVVNTGASQQNAIKNLIMTGNTAISGTGRLDIRGNGTVSDASLVGNGYSLTKVGTNQLFLANLDEIDLGYIYVNGGELGIEGTTYFGNGLTRDLFKPITVATGATLSLSNSTDNAKNLTLQGGTLQTTIGSNSYHGQITLDTAGGIINNCTNSEMRYLGRISGTGDLTKTGLGITRLNSFPGDYSYAGNTIINSGTLSLEAVDMLPFGTGKGNVTLCSSSAILSMSKNTNINGLNGTAGSVKQSGNNIMLTVGNGDAGGNYMGTIDGNLSLTKVGNGVQCLSGKNTYSGDTIINAGTLALAGQINSLPYGIGKGNIGLYSSSAILDLNYQDTNINGLNGSAGSVQSLSNIYAAAFALGNGDANGNYMGTIDGNLSLTKVGSGVQTLSGKNTYSGDTIIKAGTLKLTSTGSIASSLIDVYGGCFDVSNFTTYTLGNGKTIRGNGTVLGSMTVQGSGTVLATVSPGESPGILTVGKMVFSNASALNIEIGGVDYETAYDVLNSTDTISLLSGSTLNVSLINSFKPALGETFDVLNFKSISGVFSSVNLPDISAQTLGWNLNNLYTDGSISVMAVPEPGELAILVSGALSMLMLIVRRRFGKW